MANYLNNKTCEKIDEIKQLCENMISIGQRFLILEGGIAVGKTLFAKEVAKRLQIDKECIHFFQLHEGYSYSNFIYGQQIKTDNGKIVYESGKQPLLEIIMKCISPSDTRHIVILDDMNRCNVSAVLGDLLTALESNEVGNVIKTDKEDVKLPDNIFFIGTINPLVGKESIDYAWFRRFTILNLKAESCYFESEKSGIKEYELFKWYAKELYEHTLMLFERYFTDGEKRNEIEKYKLGPGLFIQYDNEKFLKDNLLALHKRVRYIICPILETYVSQGVLQDYANIDILSMMNLWSNQIPGIQIDETNCSGINSTIREWLKASKLPSSIKFLFHLHAYNKELLIKMNGVNYSLVEQPLYIVEHPNIKNVHGEKGQAKNGAYLDKTYMTIEGMDYLTPCYTNGAVKVFNLQRNDYVSTKGVKDLGENIKKLLEEKETQFKKIQEILDDRSK